MSKWISKGIVKGASLMNMNNRINYFKAAPKAMEIVMEMENYVRKTNFDSLLKELIKIRVSQINGCAYCLNMHTKAAKKLNAADEQIGQLKNWREANIYSEKEKTALELAEHVTLIAEKGVDDELYQRARQHFNEQEYVDLIMVINQINAWNRISISMGNKAE